MKNNQFELEMERDRLKANLDGKKTYWYKEEAPGYGRSNRRKKHFVF